MIVLGFTLTTRTAATQSVATAMGYVALFGLGSILGMAILSYAVAWPLNALVAWAWRGLSFAAGAIAMVLGTSIMHETWPTMTGCVLPVCSPVPNGVSLYGLM